MNEYGFSQGIARNASESEYPNLWRGLVGLWCPSVGVQGNRLLDFAQSNHATLAGGPTWGGGRVGRSLSFSGSSQYASSPALSQSGSFSVMGWYFAASAAATQMILVKGDDSSSGILRFRIYLAGGSITFDTYNPSRVFFSTTATTGRWCHIALTYDGAAQKAYIDGKAVSSLAQSGTLSSSLAVEMANRTVTGTHQDFLAGRLDDIRLYSRALSPAEIMQSFSGASPLVRRRESFAFRRANVFRHRAGSRGRLLLAA